MVENGSRRTRKSMAGATLRAEADIVTAAADNGAIGNVAGLLQRLN